MYSSKVFNTKIDNPKNYKNTRPSQFLHVDDEVDSFSVKLKRFWRKIFHAVKNFTKS